MPDPEPPFIEHPLVIAVVAAVLIAVGTTFAAASGFAVGWRVVIDV